MLVNDYINTTPSHRQYNTGPPGARTPSFMKRLAVPVLYGDVDLVLERQRHAVSWCDLEATRKYHHTGGERLAGWGEGKETSKRSRDVTESTRHNITVITDMNSQNP